MSGPLLLLEWCLLPSLESRVVVREESKRPRTIDDIYNNLISFSQCLATAWTILILLQPLVQAPFMEQMRAFCPHSLFDHFFQAYCTMLINSLLLSLLECILTRVRSTYDCSPSVPLNIILNLLVVAFSWQHSRLPVQWLESWTIQ